MSRRMLASLVAVFLFGCRTAPVSGAAPDKGPAVPVDPAAPGTPLPLVFKPPAGTAIVESSEILRTEDVPDGGVVRESVTATLASRFSRTDGGWALVQRMPEVRVTRGGEALEDPLMEVVRRLPIDVELDATGRFVRLTSGAQVGDAVRSVFTQPEQAFAVMALFSPSAIEEQARREWQARSASLYEAPLKAGEPVRTLESVTVGPKEVPYVLLRTPKGYATTAQGKALVLSFGCEPEVPDAGPLLSCEGQQVIAVERSLPVLWWMRMSGASPVDGHRFTLEKTVRTTAVEGGN